MNLPAPLPDDLSSRAFGRADAAEAGVGTNRLRRRDVRRPFHGVQIVRTLDGLEARSSADTVRIRPGQVFSHSTAALLWGLPLPAAFAEDEDLHVSAVLPAPAPVTRGVAGHRLRIAPASTDLRGMPIVTPAEAWAQLAPLLTVDELIELGDAVLWLRRKDPAAAAELRAAAETPNRVGAAKLRRALAEIRPNCASPGETRGRLLLTRGGIPEPELNVRVVLGLAPGDMVWRDRRVVLEYEGDYHRLDKGKFRSDIERYEVFKAAGWTVVRVTADDLRPERRAALLRRVRTALA